MTSARGYTLFELLVALALLGVLAATGLPVMNEAINRNRIWTASESIGANIRQARIKAITRNKSFRVRFNCPSTDQLRVLEVTGNSTIDDATDRCDQTQGLDSGVIVMPQRVSFGTVPTLEVSGRGVFTAAGAPLPLTISVSYGSTTRTLTVSSTGQITFAAF